jgi:hypothetical protein
LITPSPYLYFFKMGRKDKLAAAARARAGRTRSKPSKSTSNQDGGNPDEAAAAAIERENHLPRLADVESDMDCGYRGGVNIEISSDESDTTEGIVGSDEETQESLFEYTDKELDENLGTLRAAEAEMIKNLDAPIMKSRSEKEWKKIEKNWKLGYTGTSKRTQQRHAKTAREQAEF